MTGVEMEPAGDDDSMWEIRTCPECGVVVLIVPRPVPDDIDAEFAVRLEEHQRRRHAAD
ncbi:hypothetical protein [Rugosimonospora africana]|uniref:hypothetical protein n=1 Tax=Rugosimonospora africana TaxID=556532 RepID=UPI001942126A|nr:hypothetical protein [Rugosimonospora africana]